MIVTIWFAMTINGYIAGKNDDTDWVKNIEEFKQRVKDFGIAVMGRRTYGECMKYNAFPYEGALNIVMTNDRNLIGKSSDMVIFTDKSPKAVLDLAQSKGFDKVFVIGGGHINGSFLSENLVDEIYLDIHPLVMAKGINIFEAEFPYVKLELIEFKELNNQILQVKYKVKK